MDIVYVDKFYQMDPQTDDLIRGSNLQKGMKVLIESYGHRMPIIDGIPKGASSKEVSRFQADKFNRWCTVSELKMSKHMASFIGIYDDGTKITFDDSPSCGWYVKKNSIPPIQIEEGDLEAKIYTVVKERLLQQDAALYHGAPYDILEAAKILAKRITEIVGESTVPIMSDEDTGRAIEELNNRGTVIQDQYLSPRVRRMDELVKLSESEKALIDSFEAIADRPGDEK